ncbi:hypothetical protein NS228_26570 [Methylobacterium indicum]|uniref:hypothetical protein n=1 Tax=Methylobacterium indicum TaxID=1775910 RepID=UPI0007341F51|nr:hypothetical protein [Methylobacterium indicum]KTS14118.1 hypothetical protein NS229_28495 [Methylobacterium indicum]KTS24865.1 hypothetical protein NS228_26570 [Methylobacterium indicum]KTS53199.1 hypothetical protein NS230_07130 [Methylobacterium indicum]
MTTRRIDKTRKPPRRPPVRTAARPNGASQSVQGETGPAGTAETAPDTVAETVAVAPAATPDAAEVVAPEPAAPESVAERETAAQPADAVSEETEAAASESPAEPAEASADVPASQEPTAHDGEAHDAEAHDAEAHDAAAQEPATQEPEPVAPQGSDEATARPRTVSSDPVPAEVPAIASAAEPAPAASPDTASAAGASKPSGAEQEVPLAALQGFIEINGRLVAFLQGEGQAAVAFWKSAMTVRSPGDLAQLQAAEMSRAIDAAFACWTDLARRMGRLATVVPSRSRAA